MEYNKIDKFFRVFGVIVLLVIVVEGFLFGGSFLGRVSILGIGFFFS